MQLNKKILISALALALAVPVAGTIPGSGAQTVQAATSTGKITLSSNIQYKVPLANAQGKTLTGQTLSPSSSTSFYGKPVIVNVRYRIQDLFRGVTINGKHYLSLGDGGYIRDNVATGTSKFGTMRITKLAYVYNSQGQRLRTYRGGSAVLRPNTYIKYAGQTYYTIPQSFFNIGQGRYLAARYVSQMNGKPLLTLSSNTYLYNRYGQRLGRSKLLRGQAVSTNSKVRNATANDQYYFYQSTNYKNKAKSAFVAKKIRGQQYLSLGKGAYIKIANVQTANGMILFTKGPITVTNTSTELYDSHFKKIDQTLKPGTKITLDKVEIDTSLSDPQLYFRIKGTNHLVYWGDYGEYPGAERTANFDPDYADIYSFSLKQFMER